MGFVCLLYNSNVAKDLYPIMVLQKWSGQLQMFHCILALKRSGDYIRVELKTG